MEKEIWKDIEGYEGIYEISNLGRIKALERLVNNRFGTLSRKKEKILKIKLSSNTKRYIDVMLWKEGKFKSFLLHRLLALHFIPNPGMKPIINHIDHNCLNNSLDNLEWTTQSKNIKHAFDSGRCEHIRKIFSEALKLRHKMKDVRLKNYRNYATI